MNRLSKLISYLCHPLLMPTVTFGVVYSYLPELIYPMSWLSIPYLFFSTFLIPLVSIYMLKVLSARNILDEVPEEKWAVVRFARYVVKSFASVRSLEMKSREERVMPFLFITLFYGMTAYMFIFKIRVNEQVALIFLSTCALLVLISLITFWFKISVHAAGISGVLGLLTALLAKNPGHEIYYPVLACIVLQGLVMTARLQLDAHRPVEVWTGTFLGGFSCFSVLYFLG